jgi:hypothetical protein
VVPFVSDFCTVGTSGLPAFAYALREVRHMCMDNCSVYTIHRLSDLLKAYTNEVTTISRIGKYCQRQISAYTFPVVPAVPTLSVRRSSGYC